MDSVDQMLVEWARERPDLDVAPLGVVARLLRLSAMATRCAETWLGPLGLTWESFSLLVTLRRAGAPYQLRPNELLQDSLLSSGAMTNRIDRVEAMGLVERLRDPNDRRGVIVQLTAEGLELANRAIEVHLAGWKVLLAGLDSDEQEVLQQLLSRLLSEQEAAGSWRR